MFTWKESKETHLFVLKGWTLSSLHSFGKFSKSCQRPCGENLQQMAKSAFCFHRAVLTLTTQIRSWRQLRTYLVPLRWISCWTLRRSRIITGCFADGNVGCHCLNYRLRMFNQPVGRIRPSNWWLVITSNTYSVQPMVESSSTTEIHRQIVSFCDKKVKCYAFRSFEGSVWSFFVWLRTRRLKVIVLTNSQSYVIGTS